LPLVRYLGAGTDDVPSFKHTKKRERDREMGERGPGGKGAGLLRATSYHTRVSIKFIPMAKAGELLLPKPEED
jgi:hypothetical protein